MKSRYKKAEGSFLLNRISFQINGSVIMDSVSVPVIVPGIHLIIGEHGSGKTTLAKIICGYITPDEGNVIFNNKVYKRIDRRLMAELGIQGVFENQALVDNLKVVDNFMLPSDSASIIPKYIHQRRRNLQLSEFCKDYGVELNPSARTESLSKDNKLKIEILKAVYHSKSIVVLDSLFEKMAASQYEAFFRIIRKAVSEGLSVIIFSEKIDELYDLADYISILRDGNILITEKVDNISRIHILRLTYTQLTQYNPIVAAKKNFTQLLKYNEAILNSLPVNLIITGPENNVEIVNKSAVKYFHLNSDDYIGAPIMKLMGTRNSEVIDLLTSAVEENEAQTYVDVPIFLETGKTLNVIKTFPIIDGPVSIGCMIIIEDITQQVGLRNQLNLSERLASVGLLAAGVAHEINTPLGTMRNYIDTMRLGSTGNTNREKLNEIDNQITYISKIIENLMLFSNSGSGKAGVYDLNNSIRELSRFLDKSAKLKNITFHLYLEERPMLIRGHEAEFKQVIMNLFKNSIEAIGKGGKVTVVSEIKNINEGDMYEITVLDTGSGIDEKISEKVFYPFFSTKKSGNNYGLGLFVSHQMVESMRGKLLIQSPDSDGCLVRIIIPAGESSSDMTECNEHSVQ